mmetsp:Transcript_46387/g.115046  ORF Transcript_46387/g.115046 Transcript_46387/m.115046 type:complete len:284 (-) Transcript_46387:38-889(-)
MEATEEPEVREEASTPRAASSSPARRSPRKSAEGAAQAMANAAGLAKDLEAIANLPWCGQAEKLGEIEREILSHYDHRICLENKLSSDGQTLKEPFIKYKSKYEMAHRERKMSMKGLNPTRLGEALLRADTTPDEVKEKVARKMRSAFAKEFIAKLERKRQAEQPKEEELQMMRKALKVDGSVQTKEHERQRYIERYVNKDAPMTKDLFDICKYYMAVFFFMCRIPFLVVSSKYFLKFLWAVRPAFVKLLPHDVSCSSIFLDHIYHKHAHSSCNRCGITCNLI